MDNDTDNSNKNNLDNKNNGNNSNKNNKNNTPINILFIAISITLLFNIMSIFMEAKTIKEIDYNEFLDMLEDGQIERVELHSGKIMIYSADETQTSDTSIWETSTTQEILYTGRFPDADLKSDLRKYDVEFTTPIIENNALLDFFLTYFLPVLLTYAILTLFFRNMSSKMGGGMFGMGKSNAKAYVQKETGVTFKDVAGQEEAKESLKEIVDFLNHPEKYTEIGAVQPKGALLVGPPGTGKTMLAKAVAGEANVTFLSIAGSDFVEMYVGLGASRVRSLYKQATENAPCIVFIDEIDAIGKKRDNNGGNDEREQTLNQLLAEMDGFDSSKGIVLLAATNRPEVLDKALLRPGRFDRRIIVERPDLKGREDILNVHAKKVKLDDNVDLNKIALATSGSVGADLANMVNEAALRAVRHKRERVKQEDLMEAVEVVIAGKEKKDRILSEQERKIVAYHEVGHALVAAMLKNTKPVQKITIVPRTMGSLGYTLQIPEEDKHLQSDTEMLEEIMVLLGGRCAEEVEFKSVTTGASNDIKRATSIARSMITLYGMSERFDMVGLEDVENRYLDGRMVTNCSEQMQYEIDQEVLKLIKECHEKARKILEDNREALDKISDFLIQKENITGEEFMSILKEIEDNKSKKDIDDTIDDMYDTKEDIIIVENDIIIEDNIEIKEKIELEDEIIIEDELELKEDDMVFIDPDPEEDIFEELEPKTKEDNNQED